MNSDASKTRRATMLDVPVDWEALEDAFELNAHGVRSYLHCIMGTVLRLVDGVTDPTMLTRVAADADYVPIEPVSSRIQYTWMESYVPTVEDPKLKKKLAKALQGKGAFRRFKDALTEDERQLDRWYTFRSEQLAPFIEAWLGYHALNPVGASLQVPQAVPSSRCVRSVASLRRSLCEVAYDLTPCDLQALVGFAEFVRDRSLSRHVSAQALAADDIRGVERGYLVGEKEAVSPVR